jgi:hypothetical protein
MHEACPPFILPSINFPMIFAMKKRDSIGSLTVETLTTSYYRSAILNKAHVDAW